MAQSVNIVLGRVMRDILDFIKSTT